MDLAGCVVGRALHRVRGRLMHLSRLLGKAISLCGVVLALWIAGAGAARASEHADQGEAYAHCEEQAAALIRGEHRRRSPRTCEYTNFSSTVGRYTCWMESRTNDSQPFRENPCVGNSSTHHNFPRSATCSARQDYVGAPPTSTASGYVRQGSISCMNGCAATWYANGDGTWSGMYSAGTVCTNDNMREQCSSIEGYHWNAYIGACEPKEQHCSADQIKNAATGECESVCPAGMVMGADGTCSTEKSECPAGNVKAPSGECLPGEGQCAAGEARRANGTCGKDSDGDGIADVDDDDPDNDGKESASGGDTCDAPPACNGGAIDCMQVKIQWRIDCNTRRNRNVSGGTCASVPVCTGEKCDALEYAMLIQQWKASCALEKLANASPGTPGGGNGGSNAMDPVSSDGVLGADLDPATVRRGFGGGWGGTPSDLEFDESGYGFVRTCPSLPTIDVLGRPISFDTAVFCDWMRLGGVFVMIMAYLAGLAIIVRS